jgi:putative FmdB family regulatory protein
MPLYEYECNSCKKRFELRQKVTDDSVSICPSCGGSVRRVIHPVGIIFKGSGFYVTDNRKGEAPSSTTGTGDAPAASKTGDGAKADSGTKSESGKSDIGAKSDSSAASSGSSSSSQSTNKPAATTSSTSSQK